MELGGALFAVLIVAPLAAWIRWPKGTGKPSPGISDASGRPLPGDGDPDGSESEPSSIPTRPGGLVAPPAPPIPLQELYAAATAVDQEFRETGRPADLLGKPAFERAVRLFRTSELTEDELLNFYTGESLLLAVCATEALARRTPKPSVCPRLLASINDLNVNTCFFALRALTTHTLAGTSVLGAFLLAVKPAWAHPVYRAVLADFVRQRIEQGDHGDAGALAARLGDEQLSLIENLLTIGHAGADAFLLQLRSHRSRRVDLDFLRSVGTLWGDDAGHDVVEHPSLVSRREDLLSALESERPRSVLLIGERGSGKTTLLRSAWSRLRRSGWQCFEAGHLELLAGQSYVGQLEARLVKLVSELDPSRRILWLVPNVHALLFTGRHVASPTGALDLLLPAVIGRKIVIVGEIEPAAFERLVQAKPAVTTAFDQVRCESLPEAATLEVARQWRDRDSEGRGSSRISDAILREASNLAQQYLGDEAGPGHLLEFLKCVIRERQDPDGTEPVTRGELVATLSRLTGLPHAVLDDREGLDLPALKRFFEARVMGQPEAVDVLVDRIAMIKAGVTDPRRPLGVFLFAGPTGTGKTEIARALAEYLFGSPERMIRLDMSELQTPESLGRLVGEPHPEGVPSKALVDRIRERPFSVILLDEFEKAHPNVWDLFLQVFDSGRLTDRDGSTADFRNAIIVLTSNLGGAIRTSAALGFTDVAPRFAASNVDRAIAVAFRKELLNRIDRIVVFEPLTREVLREILRKELREVFGRRGLRNRSWAVVWEDAAEEFLLERGVTPDLGARPLKRAIEEHLLAPLARTIVRHQCPQGDQFLFVRTDGGHLTVEFVDPDAEPAAAEPASPASPEDLRLARIALEPRGTPDEIAYLEDRLAGLQRELTGEGWRAGKHAALARMGAPGFWDSPERFAVLGGVELADRIENGIEATAALLEKLRGRPGASRRGFAADFLARLAARLFVLEVALDDHLDGRPADAFLMVELGDPDRPSTGPGQAFLDRVLEMYHRWAVARGMKLEVLERSDPGALAAKWIISVSGLGAHTLLAPESGIHVLEEPLAGSRAFHRIQVRVRVTPQPDLPPRERYGGLLGQAREAFAVLQPVSVVRRYRERPSPLVRDAVRGWRTGNLARVLDGHFDLLQGLASDLEPDSHAWDD